MAEKVIAIENLTQLGVIKDTPTVGLAPNAFTDLKNVRIRDNAVWKMKGEIDLYTLAPSIPNGAGGASRTAGEIVYITYWANPNLSPTSGYYIYILECKDSGGDVKGHRVFIKNAVTEAHESDITPTSLVEGFTPTGAKWQHTDFAGGFCLILNNGVDAPHYVMDTVGNTTHSSVPKLAMLPAWESYNAAPKVLEATVTLTYGANQAVTNPRLFDLGQKIDFTINTLYVTKKTGSASRTEVVPRTATDQAGSGTTPSGGAINVNFVPGNQPATPAVFSSQANNFDYTIYTNTDTNTTVINFGSNIVADDVVQCFVVSRNPVKTTCGVIRSFGNFLVAGNLKEVDSTNNAKTIRKMTGVVRTSDVAVPGAVPQNWNPFAAGTNTADEFTLSDTSTVQDLVPLLGNLYIYTNTSIHKMGLTNSAIAPVNFVPVTHQYGGQTTNGMIEFSGRHLVVGSNDIYIFTGNPGNIQSVADMRIRDHFYNSLNPTYESNLFVMNNKANDEIWICFPNLSSTGKCNEAIIYNYTLNNWTIRDLNNVVYGVIAPVKGDATSGSDRPWSASIINENKQFPVMAQANTGNNKLIVADVGYQFSGSNYTSFIERKSMSVTPEFYTEQFNSMALLTQQPSSASASNTLKVKTVASNAPSANIDFSSPDKEGTFTIATGYKSDVRLNGRFISYRIDDSSGVSTKWSLTGMQVTVQEGGTR